MIEVSEGNIYEGGAQWKEVKEYLKNNNFINLTEIDKHLKVFYLKKLFKKPPKNEGK